MNNSDRCDRCGAQAYVRVKFTAGELLFCGHHYDEHSPAFAESACLMEDTRKQLLNA